MHYISNRNFWHAWSVQHQFHVARNISHSLILGWDFFWQHQASISSVTTIFDMPGTSIPLADKAATTPLRCNALLVDRVAIPPMYEINVRARIFSQHGVLLPMVTKECLSPNFESIFLLLLQGPYVLFRMDISWSVSLIHQETVFNSQQIHIWANFILWQASTRKNTNWLNQ